MVLAPAGLSSASQVTGAPPRLRRLPPGAGCGEDRTARQRLLRRARSIASEDVEEAPVVRGRDRKAGAESRRVFGTAVQRPGRSRRSNTPPVEAPAPAERDGGGGKRAFSYKQTRGSGARKSISRLRSCRARPGSSPYAHARGACLTCCTSCCISGTSSTCTARSTSWTARAAGGRRSSRRVEEPASARGSNAAAATRTIRSVFPARTIVPSVFPRARSRVLRPIAARPCGDVRVPARRGGRGEGRSYGVAKPKILVCAPSNAATDNLLERVVGARVSQRRRRRVPPARGPRRRRGRADHQRRRRRRDRLETGGRDRQDEPPGLGPRAYRKQDAFQKKAASCVKRLESDHVAAAAAYSRHCAECPDGVADVETAREHTRAQDARVAEMLRVCDDRDKAVTEMARFAFALAPRAERGRVAVRSAAAPKGFARGSRGAGGIFGGRRRNRRFPARLQQPARVPGRRRTGSTPCSWTKSARSEPARRRSFRFCTARGGAC